MVGTNNAGKTTLLKALQLALTNSHFISNDDFFYCEEHIDDTIIVDVLFVPLDEDGNVTSEFNESQNDESENPTHSRKHICKPARANAQTKGMQKSFRLCSPRNRLSGRF